MIYALICISVFLAAYTINLTYISVFYHRAFAHGAIQLPAYLRRWIVLSGNWVTGLDPKGWICMHRMHHQFSDTPKDPHSPVYQGVKGVLSGQLRSYKRTIVGLMKNDERFLSFVKDFGFKVSWLNRKKLWIAPYLLHLAVFLVLGFGFHVWWLGVAYYVGMLSHPVQGWMVNALAHKYGYQTFATGDNSKNNLLVAWLVAGEGLQNNHHFQPNSAKFSFRWWEVDMGYWICLIGAKLQLWKIVHTIRPKPVSAITA